ncbi:MAG: hypothetical protein AAFY70_08410 [Bacteroidota bacterium]
MDNETFDPKAFLLFGLDHFQIQVEKIEGKMIYLQHDYLIEIEGPSLYKLMHQGQVVAPFADVEQLCEFIRQDISLNYG